ncbi:MAG: DUF5684 domain-containing protein [Herbiconiux sp.]|nr:DUF5684 domain-containing protein [Herbiconiux sp.]
MNYSYEYESSAPANFLGFALFVLYLIGVWFTFLKADRPGWAAIVPFYHWYVLCKVAGKPGWWWILFIVPIANIVVGIIVAVNVARNFERGAVFGFFLCFLFPYIGYPILAWGSGPYTGPRRDGSLPAPVI